jgi:hypothetical protein
MRWVLAGCAIVVVMLCLAGVLIVGLSARSPNSSSAMVAPTMVAATSATATEGKFFEVWSKGPVASGGATVPTTFKIDKSWRLTQLMTYHYNGGRGAAPGNIGLRAAAGTTYGPWKATGQPGAAGPNSAWLVTPNVILPPGTYTVLDSDPGTWSQNSDTQGAGMAYGIGMAVP